MGGYLSGKINMQPPSNRSKYKLLYCYPNYPSLVYPDMKRWAEEYLEILKKAGFVIESFCLTIDPPNHPLSFFDLNYQWKTADKKLMQLYEKLEEKLAEGFDVLINAVGINLHPDFVAKLPVFTVFCCADDPENSKNLSKPAAYAYDLSLVCNIAEVDTYKSWGVKNVEWLPMGLYPDYYNPKLSEEELLKSLYKRDIDLFMIGDKNSPYRIDRMQKLDNAFPNSDFYGNGWKKGLLPFGKEMPYLMRSKIGPNVHNSTGPINLRLYTLPANGVMQICDNKHYLGEIFELGKEVIGYDKIDECIDLCRYYLAHENERIEIALNGWKRAMGDYTEEKIFDRIVNAVEKVKKNQETNHHLSKRELNVIGITKRQKKKILLSTMPKKILKKSMAILKGVLVRSPKQCFIERNVGEKVIEWPARIELALNTLEKWIEKDCKYRIADYGSGQQTLKRLIKNDWEYYPYDYYKRTSDTVFVNFNEELPTQKFDIIFCLGVLEYLDAPYKLLENIINNSRFAVLSYSGFTTMKRRKENGWKNNLNLEEFEKKIIEFDAVLLDKVHNSNNQWIYIIKGKNVIA